jgi:hypothetical protein
MSGSVAVSTHSIDNYVPIVGQAAINELRQLAERIGKATKERIAQHHLITHHLPRYLKLFQHVLPRRSKRSTAR